MTPDVKKKLVEEFKKEGLELTEDMAERLVKTTFKVLPVVVLSTENKFDDMLIPLFPIMEREVLGLVDKIDGEVDA